jgi:hypothetical protein
MQREINAARRVRYGALTLWVACCLAVLAAPVAAGPGGEGDDPRPRAADTASAEAAPEPGPRIVSPLKVAVDRETGGLTAVASRERTTGLSAAIARALSRSTEGLRVFDLPNGGKGVDLEGRFQHVVVVRVRADGSIDASCVDHPQGTDGRVGNGSAPADREPEDR